MEKTQADCIASPKLTAAIMKVLCESEELNSDSVSRLFGKALRLVI